MRGYDEGIHGHPPFSPPHQGHASSSSIDLEIKLLGASDEDYSTEALAEVMAEELYLLQYHLYVVALHQYRKTCAWQSTTDHKTYFGGADVYLSQGRQYCGGTAHVEYNRDRPAKKAVEFPCKKLIAE